MKTWTFWSLLHYDWLLFLSQPIVVYLDGPGIYGAGIPFLISLIILFYMIHTIKFKNIPLFIVNNKNILILVFTLFILSLIIGNISGYWTSLGYHFFNSCLIFFPTLVFLNNKFNFWLTYPLTFASLFIIDFTGAGIYAHWAGNFWFGVGGAGFHDGLFIGPITALAASIVIHYLKSILSKYININAKKVKIS